MKLVGWKRIELNKLFKFDSITGSNFESIMRRCAVIRIVAKFFDPLFISTNFKDGRGDKFGLFARESDAQDFSTSSPGILAGLQIQQAFAEEHSEQDCRKIISSYTRGGGDNGDTFKYIRIACGLPAGEAGEEPAPTKYLPASQDDDVTATVKLTRAVHEHYYKHLLYGSPHWVWKDLPTARLLHT